jgi:hypothetical protein
VGGEITVVAERGGEPELVQVAVERREPGAGVTLLGGQDQEGVRVG